MPMVVRASVASLLVAALTLSACSTSRSPAPPQAVAPSTAAAPTTDNCPRVTLRDGTGSMSRPIGQGRLQATIAETRTECTVVGNEVTVRVTVRGSVSSEGASGGADVSLPIRVAAVAGERVLYSELGQQSVRVSSTGGSEFSFADTGLRVPLSDAASVQIFAGFDEMT